MCDLVGDAIVVLADHGASAIECLGLREVDAETSRIVARPTVYLVDGSGVVRYRYVGKTIEDRPKTALLLLGVESLTTS
jgi:hypothetical protein